MSSYGMFRSFSTSISFFFFVFFFFACFCNTEIYFARTVFLLVYRLCRWSARDEARCCCKKPLSVKYQLYLNFKMIFLECSCLPARKWCTFHLNLKFLLTSFTNGDVSCKVILLQTLCNALVASKVILSLDCDMQNSASCFKQSSIGQFPANLRRWKPLDRTAQWDRFINDCIKTCGSQIRILIRSRILKKL